MLLVHGRCVMYAGGWGLLYALEMLEDMPPGLLGMLEAVQSELCLLEVLELMRCVLLCVLEAVEDGRCLLERRTCWR